MSAQKNLITLCFAAVSTLGLAACGGGDASVTETTVIEPVVDPTLEEIAAEAAAVVAATKAAATKLTAIDVATDPVAGIGGSGAYNIDIARSRSGTKITITDSAMEGDDDPKFMQVMDFGDGRTMHTRTMDVNEDGNVITEVVIVSTDIEAPKAVAFAMLNADAPYLDINPETMGGMDFQSVEIGEANQALIATDGITGVSTTVLAAVVDEDGDETVAAFETDATFDGAPGTLKCAGVSNCTVTLGADGFGFIGGGWEFTPADGATSDVADKDFLRYGFWLQKTTDEDGVLTYNEVETFAGSSLDVRGTAMVTGSATYEGGAVGVYVKNVFDSAGEIDTATSGHFKADASLTAIFGQVENAEMEGTIADSLLNTLTGDITNFALQHNEANTWAVNLQGDITEIAGTAAGSANGGGDAGTFTANFHGALADASADVTPGAVTGEFNASFSNGSVAGGFGAREE